MALFGKCISSSVYISTLDIEDQRKYSSLCLKWIVLERAYTKLKRKRLYQHAHTCTHRHILSSYTCLQYVTHYFIVSNCYLTHTLWLIKTYFHCRLIIIVYHMYTAMLTWCMLNLCWPGACWSYVDLVHVEAMLTWCMLKLCWPAACWSYVDLVHVEAMLTWCMLKLCWPGACWTYVDLVHVEPMLTWCILNLCWHGACWSYVDLVHIEPMLTWCMLKLCWHGACWTYVDLVHVEAMLNWCMLNLYVILLSLFSAQSGFVIDFCPVIFHYANEFEVRYKLYTLHDLTVRLLQGLT